MQIREGVPGAFVGLSAGLIAGGLAALVGQPLGWALVTTVALGLPLGARGGGFGLLVAAGRLPAGRFAPVALYWLVAFPLARLVHEVTVSLVLTGQARLPSDLAGYAFGLIRAPSSGSWARWRSPRCPTRSARSISE